MSHFAEINQDNVVVRVTVGDNNDPNGDEGYQWLIDNFGGRWVQTSYNSSFRNKFAGVGDIYREDLDAFISPSPFGSWILNVETFRWQPPIPRPTDGKEYFWNENNINWEEVVAEE